MDAEETHLSPEHWRLGSSGLFPVTAKTQKAGTVCGCCRQIPAYVCEVPLPLYKGLTLAGCSDTVAYATVANALST